MSIRYRIVACGLDHQGRAVHGGYLHSVTLFDGGVWVVRGCKSGRPEFAEHLDFAVGVQTSGDPSAVADHPNAVELTAVGDGLAGFGHHDERSGEGREDCSNRDEDPDADGEGLGAGEVELDGTEGAAGEQDGADDEGDARTRAVDAGAGFLEFEEQQAEGDEDQRDAEPVDGELAKTDEAEAEGDGAGDAGDHQARVGQFDEEGDAADGEEDERQVW